MDKVTVKEALLKARRVLLSGNEGLSESVAKFSPGEMRGIAATMLLVGQDPDALRIAPTNVLRHVSAFALAGYCNFAMERMEEEAKNMDPDDIVETGVEPGMGGWFDFSDRKGGDDDGTS